MVKSLKSLQAYKNLNLVIYSCNINFSKKQNKKTISGCLSNKEMVNYNDDYIKEEHNGYMMKMGTVLQDKNILVGLDIDNKEDHMEKNVEVKNGMTKWTNILNDNDFKDVYSLDTPIQKTGNNGLHYLFKVNKDDYKQLKTINGLFIDGIKYTIDFKAHNQCLLVEPSIYYNDKDEKKEYKWEKSVDNYDIMYMPLFVYNILLKSKAPKIEKKKETLLNIELKTDDETYKYINELLNNLNPDRFHCGNNWRFMARLFNNLKLSLKLFIEYSKTSSKFIDDNDCRTQFNKYINDNKYNIKTLENLSYKDDKINHHKIINKYNNVIQKINLSKLSKINKYDMDYINDRYLDYNKNKIINNKTKDWTYNNDIKSMNIKSPYDTGKTTLLKKIIKEMRPKNILFISYRKTLSYDIRTKFNELKFKSYLDEDLNSDRLIIQIESLHKLRNLDSTFISEEIDEIKHYDLIIIDEIESILNQFSSSTLGDKKRETFQLLDNLLFTCDKIITLDGDMDLRSYDFISSYGQYINIVNNIVTHNNILNIMNNKENFINKIIDDLKNDLKIAVASMSSNMVLELNDQLKNLYPNKNILVYTGMTAEEDKMKLKDMDVIFKDADVILYSPTITAGVSYDVIDEKDYFDKIYGIISSNSCSSRDFKQQLGRIRKIRDNNIYVLNNSTIKNNYNKSFYTFEDVKEELLIQNDVILTRQREIIKENGVKRVIERKVLSNYDINYIHNIVEQKNNNHYYFMHNLELTFIKSGYKVNFIDDKKTKTTGGYMLNMVLEAEDISNDKFMDLLEKQERGKTTLIDNIQLKKHFIKKTYGLETIDEDIIKPLFNKEHVYKNVCNLINEDNIKINDDNYSLNNFIKIKNINNIINSLGFTLKNNTINYNDFINNLSTLYKSNKWSNIEQLYNNSKNKINDDKIITFINKVFINYGISFKKTKKIILKSVLNKKGLQVIDRKTKQPKFKEVKEKNNYESITIIINQIYKDLVSANIYTNKLKIDDSIKDLFIFNEDNIYKNYIKLNNVIDHNNSFNDDIDDDLDIIKEELNIVVVPEKDIQLLNLLNIQLNNKKSLFKRCIDDDNIELQMKTCDAIFCYNEKRIDRTIK